MRYANIERDTVALMKHSRASFALKGQHMI